MIEWQFESLWWFWLKTVPVIKKCKVHWDRIIFYLFLKYNNQHRLKYSDNYFKYKKFNWNRLLAWMLNQRMSFLVGVLEFIRFIGNHLGNNFLQPCLQTSKRGINGCELIVYEIVRWTKILNAIDLNTFLPNSNAPRCKYLCLWILSDRIGRFKMSFKLSNKQKISYSNLEASATPWLKILMISSLWW